MKIRPYLTYQGTCEEALNLYKQAFSGKIIDLKRFSDIPSNPENPLPDNLKNQILQATLQIGDDFIRLSDCPQPLNDAESERISLAVECSVDEVKYAFEILSIEGQVGIPLSETFYSPCAGVVFDKFGVMWNFIASI